MGFREICPSNKKIGKIVKSDRVAGYTFRLSKGAVIFKAGYRGERIFGGAPNFLAAR